MTDEYRNAIARKVSPEMVTAVLLKLGAMATLEGHVEAAKVFLRYTVGDPPRPDVAEKTEGAE